MKRETAPNRLIGPDRNTALRRRGGLSVIEILVSAALIAAASVVIVRLFIGADALDRRTRQLDQAVFFSVRLFESMDREFLEEYDALAETAGADPLRLLDLPLLDEAEKNETEEGVSAALKLGSDTLLHASVTDFGEGIRIRLSFRRYEAARRGVPGSRDGWIEYYSIETECYRWRRADV